MTTSLFEPEPLDRVITAGEGGRGEGGRRVGRGVVTQFVCEVNLKLSKPKPHSNNFWGLAQWLAAWNLDISLSAEII